MQKIVFIALLTFSISVSAKVTLTAEEREVIDSLVATYSAMVPMALLPANWPPDVEGICDWFIPSDEMVTRKTSTIQSREYFFNVITKVAQTLDPSAWFHQTIYNISNPNITLPSNHHKEKTEVTFTDLDSGFVYISWTQNTSEPLALQQVSESISLAKDARCVILNLCKFDAVELDSVLKALSLFYTGDDCTIQEAIRVVGKPADTIKEYHIEPASHAWRGPLLVVSYREGWPGSIVKAALQDRPYTFVHFEARATAFTGYRYERVSLPHNYGCYVPVSVLQTDAGKLITSKISPGFLDWCGTLDPSHKPDRRALYQRYEDLAQGVVTNFRKDNSTFSQRLFWAFEDNWDRWFADDAPKPLTIE